MLIGAHNHRQVIQPTSCPDKTGDQDLQQFQRLLCLVDIVSFDLFDTLVQREGLFSPKDLFYQVQDEAKRRLGLCYKNFAPARVRAEEAARVRAWGQGREEVTLDEIYKELARMLRLESVACQSLQEIELECERAALTALESGQRLYHAALAAGKVVLIISDTYFDEGFITEILGQTGYAGVQQVYLSSMYGQTKLTGSLYDAVLKNLRVVPGRVLHIGDNQLADVTMALGRGIRALSVPTPKHYLKWRCGVGDGPSGSPEFSAMLCEISKRYAGKHEAHDDASILGQTAVENLSLLYYAFAAWLLEQLREGGYQRVYFAARDGLIIKRFFDLLAGAAGFEIDSKYLYVSRAALYPSLVFTAPETARRLFTRNWDYLTVEEALGRISLTYEEVKDKLAQVGLADRKRRLDQFSGSKFLSFLARVWPLLEHKNEESYHQALDYLRQEQLLTDERAAFVDIGWHGSLQDCVLKLLDHLGLRKDLQGYYLGTFEKPVGARADFKATGYLVDNGEPGQVAGLVRYGPSLIELFHNAGHGSVLGYKRNGVQVLPVLEDNQVEREQFMKYIEPVQNLAFEFISNQLQRLPHEIRAPEPGLVARTALRVIYAPTAAEATTFGRLKIASDFGGRMKSITGVLEWDIKKIKGETLPDSTVPIWRPGFLALKDL